MRHPTQIVAILNVTQDSFSDGGRFLAPEAAIEQAETMLSEGADWIDVGPASSNPDAALVPAEEQNERLRPVLDRLRALGCAFSVDATLPSVLRFAIESGAKMLNDVRGFGDPEIYPDLAATDAKLVVVHSLLAQERATRDAASVPEVLESIDRFFEERLDTLVRAGVSEDRLIIDPGMGFFLGSNAEASIAALQRIEALDARFGRPIFISVSRKSFLRTLTGSDVSEIGAATLAAELYAIDRGASYIRTHDPRALRDARTILAALDAKE